MRSVCYHLASAASAHVVCAVAVTCLIKANDIFVKNGRFHIAATHEKEIAEIYETQLQDYPQAIKFYLSAADRFAIDDSVAIAQSCSIKAAMLAANMEDYEKAAGLFEENAESSAHDQLRKYSVKDHLFRAGLCRLCLDVSLCVLCRCFNSRKWCLVCLDLQDLVGAKRAFARYSTIDYAFSTSKEHELLDSLAAVIETGDVEQFTELVTKWDRTNAMDEWKTRVLLKIKQSMDEEPSLT